jgi:hypothetical protein
VGRLRNLNTVWLLKIFFIGAEVFTDGGLVGVNEYLLWSMVLLSLSGVFPVAAREEHVGGLLLRLKNFSNIRWNSHVPFVGKLLFEVIRNGVMLLWNIAGNVLIGLRFLIFIIRIVGLLNRLIVFLDNFVTSGSLEILETTLEKIFLSKFTSS